MNKYSDFDFDVDELMIDEAADNESLYDWNGEVIVNEMTLDQLKNYINEMKEDEILTISF